MLSRVTRPNVGIFLVSPTNDYKWGLNDPSRMQLMETYFSTSSLCSSAFLVVHWYADCFVWFGFVVGFSFRICHAHRSIWICFKSSGNPKYVTANSPQCQHYRLKRKNANQWTYCLSLVIANKGSIFSQKTKVKVSTTQSKSQTTDKELTQNLSFSKSFWELKVGQQTELCGKIKKEWHSSHPYTILLDNINRHVYKGAIEFKGYHVNGTQKKMPRELE